MTETSDIRFAVEGGVAFVTLSRPKALNALTLDMVRAYYPRLRAWNEDPAIRAVVISGEIDMLMDDTEVHMKAGDIMVQQGTNHAWVNNSDKVCRMAFVLIDADEPPAWKLGE